jgi:DNA modification methylase
MNNEQKFNSSTSPAIVGNAVLPAVPSSEVYLEDCVTALKRYADNHFDLAIVDPPYGLGIGTVRGLLKRNELKADEFKAFDTKDGMKYT